MMTQPIDHDLTKQPRPPKARPGSAGFVWFLTVLFLVVAGIAIHDAIVAKGHIGGPSWLGTVSSAIGDMHLSLIHI